MRIPLIIIRIYLLARALPAFWKRSPPLPVRLMETTSAPLVANAWAGTITASRRSNLSFNRGDPVSKLLTQEGQRVEAIVGFSRGSGR
jgi:multidrug efflux pump subunit AcrA (membrane-fusion protein)